MDSDAESKLLDAIDDDSSALLADAISCSTWDKVSIFESLLNSVACGGGAGGASDGCVGVAVDTLGVVALCCLYTFMGSEAGLDRFC